MFWLKALLFGCALSLAAWHYGAFANLQPADVRASLAVVSQIAATMLGFVLAALAILSTIAGSKLLRNMQKTGHYRVLLERMLSVTAAFGVLMTVSLVCIFVPIIPPATPYPVLALTAACFVGLADICQKLWRVLSNLTAQP